MRYAVSFAKPERPKFIMGTVVMTQGISEILSHEDILSSLKRHMLGDWGDLCKEDIRANESALALGGRLLSKYKAQSGVSFYIITEGDRSYTTLLLPEEY